jgi:hypothetical protein
MSHQFVRFLARRIEANRMIDVVMHRERQPGVGAIDRRRRRKQQVTAAVASAPLRDIQEACKIGVDIGPWILQRRPSAIAPQHGIR